MKRLAHYQYPSLTKTMENFHLTVEGGEFTDSEIIVLLGENGTGKTTLIRFTFCFCIDVVLTILNSLKFKFVHS